MRYDVIIVGAGPAGSTAARDAAARGLGVLLLDKAEFPRDKPCGGGVNVRTARLLPFDLAPVVERTIFGMRVDLDRGGGFSRSFPEPIAHLTQRRRLDAFLVERAVAAGATLRERTAVRAVERGDRGVIVRTDGGTFEGRTLVAADGANGRTARLAGIAVRRRLIVALEGNVSPPGGVPAEWTDRLGLLVGDHPGGYGWLFPKGDHLNLGVGVWQPLGPSLRGRLDRVSRHYGFDPADLWGLRGHHLPIRAPGAPVADGDVLVAPPAAGLLDPFTGEGIYAAVWSGSAAARHIATYLGGEVADPSGYAREVERVHAPELSLAGRVQDLFHLTPRLYVALIGRASPAWTFGCRMMRGERTYADLRRKLGPLALGVELLSDLIRVTPRLRRRVGLDGLPEPPPPEGLLGRRRAGGPPVEV